MCYTAGFYVDVINTKCQVHEALLKMLVYVQFIQSNPQLASYVTLIVM